MVYVSHTFKTFSSHEPKAQDELLWSFPVRPFARLKNFTSETPGPNFFKLHMEPSVKGGLKFLQIVTVR